MQHGRNFARTILPIMFAAFIAAGCDGSSAFGGIPDGAVCSVDGRAITKKEFDRYFDNAEKQYADNNQDFPKKGSDEYETLRSDLVEYLVQQKLIQNQADKFDLKASKKDIDKGVDELKQQVAQGDEKKFKEEMERVNYTIALVEKDVEFDVISKKLYDRIVDDVKISDADAKKHFDENPDQYTEKESREIAHILVKKKSLADEIYEQVKGGDEKIFTKLAKKHTEDPSSKETGGVLPGGSVQRGQTVPEFDKMSFELKTGEVSKPVKTTYGWHVISARGDIKPEKKKKFDDVKKDIKTQLKGEKEGARYQEYNTDVREDAEESVECRDGYVWKQTVTETETAPEPAAEEEAADEEATGDEKAGDDAKADSDKADSDKADDEKADDEKAEGGEDAAAKDEAKDEAPADADEDK